MIIFVKVSGEKWQLTQSAYAVFSSFSLSLCFLYSVLYTFLFLSLSMLSTYIENWVTHTCILVLYFMYIENSLLHYLYWCIELRSLVVALSFALCSMKSWGQGEKEIHQSRIHSFSTAVASASIGVDRNNRSLCTYISMSSNSRLTNLSLLSFLFWHSVSTNERNSLMNMNERRTLQASPQIFPQHISWQSG